MNISHSNVPKQAQALLAGSAKVSTYESTGGEVTTVFALDNLKLLPFSSIAPGSVIHDNACGSGNVTRLILSLSAAASGNLPKNLKIYATDIDQPFLDKLDADVKDGGWHVEVSKQRGEELNFEDEKFDLSITNIGVFFFTSAGLDGAKEIHRTLKPGGTAIVNCWQHITWQPAIFAVHKAFHSSHPFKAPITNWSDGKQLQKVMLEAGFEAEKMRVETSEAWAKIGGGEQGFRHWCEKTWAYLAGVVGWFEEDEQVWDEEVEMVGSVLMGLGEESGVKVVQGKDGEEIWLRANQWVVIAQK